MKKAFIYFLFVIFIVPVFSLEIPSDGVMDSVLGKTMYDEIERGITYSDSESVRASGHGFLLMKFQKRFGFPSAMGNSIIIAHDNGLLSVYGNLEEDSVIEFDNIQSGSTIARTGSSAFGNPGDLPFQVIDTIQKAKLNPLLLLPEIQDKSRPALDSLVLTSSQGTDYTVYQNRRIRPGEYKICVSSYDTIGRPGVRMPVYKTTFFVNGEEKCEMRSETLKEKDGILYYSAGSDIKIKPDSGKGTEIGSVLLRPGKNTVSIELVDLAKNSSTFNWVIWVE